MDPPWRSTPSLSERLSAVSRRLLGASSFRGFRPNSNFSGPFDPQRLGFSTTFFILKLQHKVVVFTYTPLTACIETKPSQSLGVLVLTKLT